MNFLRNREVFGEKFELMAVICTLGIWRKLEGRRELVLRVVQVVQLGTVLEEAGDVDCTEVGCTLLYIQLSRS